MWKLISGVFLGWSLGANDSANIFGTGVATGTVKYRTAIALTAVFVVAGALIEGPKCMRTLGEISLLVPIAAFCCTLAAGVTMAGLTLLAIPASASQAIVGSIVGAGIVYGNADFTKLYKVVVCWVMTPLCGILLGYLIYRLLELLMKLTVKSLTMRSRIYFGGIIIAGCYGAYSLGANNVANVTGVYVSAGQLEPMRAALIGGLSIALGALTFSEGVMLTVGKGIVPLDPFSAFVVVLAEALTLHFFTQVGVPVSSSQAVVGAVVGVGLVGGLRTVSARSLFKISVGWLMTPLSAGLISAALLLSLKYFPQAIPQIVAQIEGSIMQLSRLHKFYIVFAAAFVSAMALSGYYLQKSMKEKLTAHLRDDGLLIARTIARALPAADPPEGLDDFCAAYRNDTRLRITVISPDGRVTGESHRSSEGMENHGGRPEVRAAFETGVGWAIRRSDTLEEDMLYTAVLTDEPVRVVRVAMPLTHMRRIENEIMLAVSVFLYLIPFLAALMLAFAAYYLKRTSLM
jgi:PiT family inorganic phosphate transporter